MTSEELKAIEGRDDTAPDEDELHARADDLEKAHGIGESISIDDACATLRAMAQGRHDRHVPALCAAVRERDATIAKLLVEFERAAEMAASQAPDVPDDTPDEYRRGQRRGALDAAAMIRRGVAAAVRVEPPTVPS
jgi:hypothetical protein